MADLLAASRFWRVEEWSSVLSTSQAHRTADALPPLLEVVQFLSAVFAAVYSVALEPWAFRDCEPGVRLICSQYTEATTMRVASGCRHQATQPLQLCVWDHW